jgi:hypothetical protein
VAAWGKTGTPDLNKDGTVNVLDMSMFLSLWTG